MDEEAVEGGEAVLPVDVVREAAPLLRAFHPAVEAHVPAAGAVHARLLLVLARAQDLAIVVGVWDDGQGKEKCENKRGATRTQHHWCTINSAQQD